MAQLSIRKDSCDLDFLSLGALVHRLDPGIIPFRKLRLLIFTFLVANTMSLLTYAIALVSRQAWLRPWSITALVRWCKAAFARWE